LRANPEIYQYVPVDFIGDINLLIRNYDKILDLNSNVISNCFNADVSQADVITCWFSILPGTKYLMDKLYKEMKPGAKFIKCSFTDHIWKPDYITSKLQKETFQNNNVWRVEGQLVCLYIK
jgi:hypothetical protein